MSDLSISSSYSTYEPPYTPIEPSPSEPTEMSYEYGNGGDSCEPTYDVADAYAPVCEAPEPVASESYALRETEPTPTAPFVPVPTPVPDSYGAEASMPAEKEMVLPPAMAPLPNGPVVPDLPSTPAPAAVAAPDVPRVVDEQAIA